MTPSAARPPEPGLGSFRAAGAIGRSAGPRQPSGPPLLLHHRRRRANARSGPARPPGPSTHLATGALESDPSTLSRTGPSFPSLPHRLFGAPFVPANQRALAARRRRLSGRAPVLLRLAAAVLVATAVALTGAAPAAASERRFEPVPLRDELPDTTVEALAIDHQGFLWIGTEEGVHRWDGSQLRTFRRSAEGSPGLGANRVSALLVTSDGTLWAGTRGGGLSRFDAALERFDTFRHRPDDPGSPTSDDVVDLAEDAQGRIWVATMRAGVSVLADPTAAQPHFTGIRHDEDDPGSLPSDGARALLVTRDGAVWVATMGGVAVLRDPGAFADPHFLRLHHDPDDPGSLPDDEVWALHEARDGSIWVGMWGGGLSRLRPEQRADLENARFETFDARQDHPHALGDNRVMQIFEDSSGESGGPGALWIATLDGLFELPASERYAPQPRFLAHPADPLWRFSVPEDHTNAFVEDRDGDLWIGTRDGPARLDRASESFVRLRVAEAEGLPGLSGGVRDALIDRHGVLWVATTSGLDRVELASSPFERHRIERFPRPEDDLYTPPDFEMPRILRLLESRDGSLWMASYAGLLRLDPERRRVERTLEGLSSNAVLSLHEDSFGTLWVGTYRGLERVLRDERGAFAESFVLRHDPEDPATLSNMSVGALASQSDGTLWAGTYAGLNRLRFPVDPSQPEILRLLAEPRGAFGLAHDDIDALAVGADDTLWVGTHGGGVHRLEHGADPPLLESYGVADGLPSDIVGDVAIAARSSDGRAARGDGGMESVGGNGADGSNGRNDGSVQHVWIATPRGLVLHRPDHETTGRDRFTTFGVGHGLADDGVGLVRTLPDGRLLVATHGELTLLDPRRLEVSVQPPLLRLTGLRVRNQPVMPEQGSLLERSLLLTDELTLRHSDSLIALEFAGVTFRRPDELHYRYRLEGLDESWVPAAADDRKATYTTLPPGRYAFRVQAREPSGEWSPHEGRLAVHVLPPWWMTWWARGAAALLLALVAAAVPLLHAARVRRRNRELEQRVAERTADLEHANQQLADAARSDFLTGLPNRRAFFERAEVELAAARRADSPLAVVLGDLDHFSASTTPGATTAATRYCAKWRAPCAPPCASATWWRAGAARRSSSCSPTPIAKAPARSPRRCAAPSKACPSSGRASASTSA
ncbi:MAG: diguanylate cyclase [Acidobacteria bacterium]|nr:MAG: diguanylate cyclase [Acidobacteriota bacterium]